jgi:hypothetical protein
MKKITNIGEIELRGDRLILHYVNGIVKLEFDITGVWHFCKEVYEYQKQPKQNGKWK